MHICDFCDEAIVGTPIIDSPYTGIVRGIYCSDDHQQSDAERQYFAAMAGEC